MARKTQSDGHKTETPDVSHIRNIEVTHETSDVNVRGVLTFGVVLAISTAVVAVGLVFLFKFFNQQQAREEPKPGPMALRKDDPKRLPPAPRLQSAPGFEVTLENGQRVNLERSAPQAEYQALRKQWEENLKTGLKDQSGRVVGISIDDAIKKIVSEAAQTKGPPGKLQDYAITMPTAASSGRETEKRQ